MRYNLCSIRARVLLPTLIGASVFGFFVACAPPGKATINKTNGSGSTPLVAAKAAVSKIYSSYNETDAQNIALSARVQGVTATVSPSATNSPTLGLTDVAAGSVSSTTETADLNPAATTTVAAKTFFDVNVKMLVTDESDDAKTPAFMVLVSGTIYAGEEKDYDSTGLGVTSASTLSADTSAGTSQNIVAPADTTAAAPTAPAAPAGTGAPAQLSAANVVAPSPTPALSPRPSPSPVQSPTPAPAAGAQANISVLTLDTTNSSPGIGSRFAVQSYCGNADCSLLLVRLVERYANPTPGGSALKRQFVVVFQTLTDAKNPKSRVTSILWSGRSVATSQASGGRRQRVTTSPVASGGHLKTTYEAALAKRTQQGWAIAMPTAGTSPVATPVPSPAPTASPAAAPSPATPAAVPSLTEAPAVTAPHSESAPVVASANDEGGAPNAAQVPDVQTPQADGQVVEQGPPAN
jgi:hypothetical protein